MSETWLITLIFTDFKAMDKVLLTFVKPEVERFQRNPSIRTWHFFREQELEGLRRPYLLLRVQGDKNVLLEELKPRFEEKLEELKSKGMISDYRIEEDPRYSEEHGYGKEGWPIAQKIFEYMSTAALFIIEHRNKKVPLPPDFHERKFIHCFLNQVLGTYTNEAIFYELALGGLLKLFSKLKIMPDCSEIPILADKYAEEFNRRYPSEPGVLSELSLKLCDALDEKVPYFKEGKRIAYPLENQMWALALIAAAWLGWVMESKAIEHYGVPHPEMREILVKAVIPSVVESFNIGRSRAMREKGIR